MPPSLESSRSKIVINTPAKSVNNYNTAGRRAETSLETPV